MARYNWCNFGKLGLMLGFGQRKYPLLPFVIGLFTHAIFFTPAFHSQSAIPAFRDPPGPHSQLVLLIQLLQFCTHNKNHPRIADSTRESRILSATIREYCVTLSFCAQVAVSFDGYIFMVIYMKKNAFIFVSISFLCVTFFSLLPLLYSFGMTFFCGRGNELVFSGFDNYTRILEDKSD